MKKIPPKIPWMILYYLCLISFTVYITMDTFVISRSLNTDATEMNTSMFSTQTDSEDGSDAKETDSSEDGEASSGDDNGKDDLKNGGFQGESSEGGGNRGSGNGGLLHHRQDGSKFETGSTGSGKSGGSSGSSSSKKSGSSSSGTVSLKESGSKEKTWKDENISVSLKEYRANNTTVYAADVKLTSAEYLKTAFAQKTYGKNVTQTTSEMAEDNNAVLAINGDNYGSQEKGCVIRNGIVYREQGGSSDLLCIYADGSMKVTGQSEASAEELVKKGVWQAFSFGPGLIENGEITVAKDQEVGIARASNPRTAIGYIDKLHYVFVVSDGRTEASEGLSLHELADLMKQLGAKTAYNLDGGGSSTMVFNGEVINQPTSTGRTIEQRKVNDIVYLG